MQMLKPQFDKPLATVQKVHQDPHKPKRIGERCYPKFQNTSQNPY